MEKEFLEEISGFNRDFSLVGVREALSESTEPSENLQLEREVETLRRGAETLLLSPGTMNLNNSKSHTVFLRYFPYTAEMELMSSRDPRLNLMREEKRRLQLELQGLDTIQTGEYRSFIFCDIMY